MTEIKPYKIRRFRFAGIWRASATCLKAYVIVRQDVDREPDGLAQLAHDYAVEVLPAMVAQEGNDHRLGYAILHAGEMSNWLLLHWWAHGDIAMRHLASCDDAQNGFVSQDGCRFHACVWEHIVISHERDAWVRHMSDPARRGKFYLEDRLPDGPY
ncbi:hypothetical protein [Erythrobacter sp. JK5]|uniref:hypothetical protein n=1 Tax=Erythrobacter sp. JK5 TaxID=2829500 RepID=UPI001BABB4EC|nr:hypothetical protein [Erythrobacter sp. JK5]QUL37627.1 hypothetical protein KDC96_14980 [Erythrobacter sp. JK5]